MQNATKHEIDDYYKNTNISESIYLSICLSSAQNLTVEYCHAWTLCMSTGNNSAELTESKLIKTSASCAIKTGCF